MFLLWFFLRRMKNILNPVGGFDHDRMFFLCKGTSSAHKGEFIALVGV